MKTFVINDIQEYINLLEIIGSINGERWFRGQNKCEYRLSPSALRKVYAIEDSRGYKIDPPREDDVCSGSNNLLAHLPVDKMILEFRNKANKFLEYDAETMVEWECIAQHYGIPTRVLDWTTNALNALFFAVEDCLIGETQERDIEYFYSSKGFGTGGGAVFVIDPLEINRISVPIDGFEKDPVIFDVRNHANLIDSFLHNALPPICFHGFNKEKRISRQAGNFTTTGTLLWPLDFYTIFHDIIIKIFIPYNSYELIRRQLKGIGITHDTIYVEDDEKDKIAKEIALKTKEKFDDFFQQNRNMQ